MLIPATGAGSIAKSTSSVASKPSDFGVHAGSNRRLGNWFGRETGRGHELERNLQNSSRYRNLGMEEGGGGRTSKESMQFRRLTLLELEP